MTHKTNNREQITGNKVKKGFTQCIFLCYLLPVICYFVLSCLQSVSQGKFPEYIPSAQNIQSPSFSCDNNDLLIVTVSGAVLHPVLKLDYFILTREGEEIPVSNFLRADDNCALLGFDSALRKNYDYRLTVDSDAVIPGDFSQTLSVKPVSSGKFTGFETTAFENASINSLCYVDGRYITDGEDGRMTYLSGRFIAAGGDGRMAYLADPGPAWTAIKPGESSDGNKFTGAIYGIAGGNNRLYAVGEGARMAATFNNGLDWSRPLVKKGADYADKLFSGDDILCIAWSKGAAVSGGRFVVAGKNGKLLFESETDVWNESVITLGEGEFDINALVWGDTGGAYGTFIAAGSVGALFRSANGSETWTPSESQFDDSDIYCGAFGKKLFVIGGQNGLLAWSSAGDKWETAAAAASAAADADILAIAFGGGIFVAVGDKGFMAMSDNGISWTEVTDNGFDENDKISAVATDGRGKFVAAGNSRNDNKSKIVYWYQKPAL